MPLSSRSLKSSIYNMTSPDYELGWIVGLLEGEGSFSAKIHKRSSTRQRRTAYLGAVNAQLGMSDEDVVRRAADVVARLTGLAPVAVHRYQLPPPWKATYRAHWTGDRGIALLRLIAPLMGLRRGAKVKETLAIALTQTGPAWKQGERSCARGHKYKVGRCHLRLHGTPRVTCPECLRASRSRYKKSHAESRRLR